MTANKSPLYIGLVGTGGYAREVMPMLQSHAAEMAKLNIKAHLCFVDVNESDPVHGIPVIAEADFLALDGEKQFNIAIADSKLREKIALKYEQAGCSPLNIHPENFINLSENKIARGAIFSPFSCVTADTRIGKYFHCNLYSYVAHDCVIGNFVTFAPKVCCNGNVFIEDHAYIGTGAIIKQGTPENPIVIGAGAVVGMGAVVTKNVAPGAVVIGNPAKPMQK